MKVAVLGARGRMGRTVVRLAQEAGMTVVAEIDSGDALTFAGADVLVDFSSPAVAARAFAACAKENVAIASGTTGLEAEALAALEAAGRSVPVLWEPNMSVGAQAVAALGPGYDIEIVETHHRKKVDAPSGTALRLAEVAKAARSTPSRFVTGREGKPGARTNEEIGVLALRGGDVIGDHTAFLFGDGERIELTHRASSRDLFAHGALRAAGWLVGKPAGRYRLGDVLA